MGLLRLLPLRNREHALKAVSAGVGGGRCWHRRGALAALGDARYRSGFEADLWRRRPTCAAWPPPHEPESGALTNGRAPPPMGHPPQKCAHEFGAVH